MGSNYYAYISYRKEAKKVTDLVAEFGRGYGKRYQDLAKVYGSGYHVTTVPLATIHVWDAMVDECKAQGYLVGERRGTYLLDVPVHQGQTLETIFGEYKKRVDQVIEIMNKVSKDPKTLRPKILPKSKSSFEKTVRVTNPAMELTYMLNADSLTLEPEIKSKMIERAKVWKEIQDLAKAEWNGTTLTMTFKGALYKEDAWIKLIDRMALLWPEESKSLQMKRNLLALHYWLKDVMLLPEGILSHQASKPPTHILQFDVSSWSRFMPKEKECQYDGCTVPSNSWASL